MEIIMTIICGFILLIICSPVIIAGTCVVRVMLDILTRR